MSGAWLEGASVLTVSRGDGLLTDCCVYRVSSCTDGPKTVMSGGKIGQTGVIDEETC